MKTSLRPSSPARSAFPLVIFAAALQLVGVYGCAAPARKGAGDLREPAAQSATQTQTQAQTGTGTSAGTSTGSGIAPGAGAPVIADKPTGPGLAKVLQDKLTGADGDAPDQRALLEKRRDAYLKFRRSRDRAVRTAALAACTNANADSAIGQDPFCPAIVAEMKPSSRGRGKSGGPRGHHRGGPAGPARVSILRDLSSARLERLASVSENDLRLALRHVRDFDKLRPLVDRVLSDAECAPASLMTLLGQRAEENFPQPAALKTAQALYEKSVSCSDEAPSVRAAYRLGLILLWQGKFGDADAMLRKAASSQKDPQFRSRAIYWQAHCAHKLDKKEEEAELRARLLREFPLSLHALLAGEGTVVVDPPIINSADPLVRFRSAAHPELNPAVAAAESLQSAELPEAAYQVLNPILENDRVRAAEPSFQLYVAVLLMRSGEPIRKFQLLTGIFHDSPQLISKSTLEMLYPLSNYGIARSHGALVDPMLVLALIRQESAFNQRARSRADARGLMQLLPSTARRIERRVTKNQLYDPVVNMRVGVKYFAQLLDRYGGEAELALASYNAGPEKVDDWVRRYPVEDRLLFLDLIPFRETREYVSSIARNYYWYLRLYEADRLRQRVIEQSRIPAAGRRPTASASGVAPHRGFSVLSLAHPVRF